MLHDGPGAAASAEPSRRWQAIATTLDEVGQDLRAALEHSGANWSGKAAGAAYDRLSRTAAWASDTGAEAAGMRSSVESQADHIARARADMPAPEDVPPAQPDPTLAPAVQIAQAQADLERAEGAASAAAERAFEVMAAYELNTNATTGGLATFEKPADLSHHEHVHKGSEVMGSQHTHSASVGTLGLQGGPTNSNGHNGNWHWSGGGWSEPESRRPVPATFSGLLGLGGSDEDREHRPTRRLLAGGNSNGIGSGGPGGSAGEVHGVPGTTGAPSVGATAASAPKPGMLVSGVHTDLQTAAAGQAAAGQAVVHQASASTVASGSGAGAPVTGGHERVALRRFGMDAIGSNQWFGDADDAVVGALARRRDFTETAYVVESVDILGTEHKLSPTVIGDGQPDR